MERNTNFITTQMTVFQFFCYLMIDSSLPTVQSIIFPEVWGENHTSFRVKILMIKPYLYSNTTALALVWFVHSRYVQIWIKEDEIQCFSCEYSPYYMVMGRKQTHWLPNMETVSTPNPVWAKSQFKLRYHPRHLLLQSLCLLVWELILVISESEFNSLSTGCSPFPLKQKCFSLWPLIEKSYTKNPPLSLFKKLSFLHTHTNLWSR